MIRLGCLFPEHLNLNGDFGNLDVISKQLEWRGLAFEVVPVVSSQDLDRGLNFVFVGHGSNAAWDSIQDQFALLAPALRELKSSGTPGLSISSGFEKLVALGIFSELSAPKVLQRVSKFVVHPDQAGQVLGYLNTDLDLPITHREAKWIGSMLHGPVLSKNSGLLEEVLRAITAHANVSLPAIQVSEKAGQLADLIEEVWKLERELASE